MLGRVAEWFKAPVLKDGCHRAAPSWGVLFSQIFQRFLELLGSVNSAPCRAVLARLCPSLCPFVEDQLQALRERLMGGKMLTLAGIETLLIAAAAVAWFAVKANGVSPCSYT
jgi:hypothetical protein